MINLANGYSSPTDTPNFEPGEVVQHIRYGYRGVIVDFDSACMAPDDWYQSNQTRPDRNQPWYHVLVDGNRIPSINNYKIKAIVKGDKKIPAISAASIIAKVARDNFIVLLSKKNKGYHWDKNFGYGTKQHLKAIKKLGVNQHHRKTFKPIAKLLKHNI